MTASTDNHESSVASRGLYVCGQSTVLMDECSCVAWRVDGLRRWDPSYSDGRISERVVSSEQLLNRGPEKLRIAAEHQQAQDSTNDLRFLIRRSDPRSLLFRSAVPCLGWKGSISVLAFIGLVESSHLSPVRITEAAVGRMESCSGRRFFV